MTDPLQTPVERQARTGSTANWWMSIWQRLLWEFRDDFPPEKKQPAENPDHSGWIRLTGATAAGSLTVLVLLWVLFQIIPGSLTVNATSTLLHKEARAARESMMHDLAARRFEEALAIGFRQASQTRSVRQEYVQSLVDAGHQDKAMEVLKPLAENGLAGIYELLTYAELLLASNHAEDALKWARETQIRAEKENQPAVRGAAMGVEGGALLAMGNLPEAREKLETALKTWPGGDAAVYLARLLRQEGNSREAQLLLQRYLLGGGRSLTAEARALHREITSQQEADRK